MSIRISLLFFLLFIISSFSSCHTENGVSTQDDADPVPVLVISVDAFRWDYIDRIRRSKSADPEVRSFLLELIENGTYAPEGIESVFSTTIYPSQYTLVTGLFQENHGVVSDIVYDPESNRTADLKMHDSGDGWVFGGEPIWTTMRNNFTPLVGCYMWTGCEHGRINNFVPFNEKISWVHRVETAIDWLKEGLRLILVSAPEIEAFGRDDGPDSDAMDTAFKQFNQELGHLWEKLEKERLNDRVNLIIVSGHGMTTALKSLQLESELPSERAQFFHVRSKTPTMWLVEPFETREDDTFHFFNGFEHLRVFKKDDIPSEWHYGNNQRVSPIVVLADPGYALGATDSKALYGYNTSFSDMRGTFIGYGPAFSANSTVPSSMSTVDVYQLLCLLLNVKPAPNNGTTKSFENFLMPNYLNRLMARTEKGSVSWTVVAILITILVLGIIIGSWLCYRTGECGGKRQSNQGNYRTTTTIDSMVSGEQALIKHKYDSELVILELDDGAVNA